MKVGAHFNVNAAIILFGVLLGCLAISAHSVREIGHDSKGIGVAAEEIDGAKISVVLCEKKTCYGEACYCCLVPPEVCYNTMEVCRQIC
ncbi:hypothetical protein ACP70R_033629 [Stipagrostis hirtigluma subsp. patula]